MTKIHNRLLTTLNQTLKPAKQRELLWRAFRIDARAVVATATLLTLTALVGCVNGGTTNNRKNAANTASNTNSGPQGYVISGVNMVVDTPAATNNNAETNPPAYSGQYLVQVSFDSSQSLAITNGCDASLSSGTTSVMPCQCNLSWSQISASGTTDTHNIAAPAIDTQSYSLTCAVPAISTSVLAQAAGSIPIQVNVIPVTPNTNSFDVAYSYGGNTNSSATNADFTDSSGNAFFNVLHYSCFDQVERGMSIVSRVNQVTNPTTGQAVGVPSANDFCVRKALDSSGISDSTCSQLGNPDFTAQSYYHNLYVRTDTRGNINRSNSAYYCPLVQEPLTGSSGQGQYYPLDSNFALARSPTSLFTVCVEAFSWLSDGSGDPSSAGSSCGAAANSGTGSTTTSTTSSSSTSSLVATLLGYAAPPNSDGSCPSFTNSSGQTLHTYRLRRYVTLYPNTYDTDGSQLAQTQPVDTVYVADRPVIPPSGSTVPNYTMLGPKPCPFAFFNSHGVAQKTVGGYPLPTYAATNNATLWQGPDGNGVNPDGIQLPNYDSPNSCSAAVPILSGDSKVWTVATVNALNRNLSTMYIRPMKPWAPHYVEDTTFQACVPQASNFVDPPLHFAKDSSGNVSWCAEVYPTQNENLSSLDNGSTGATVGYVVPYTSHVPKNTAPTAAKSSCTATALTSFPSGYAASASGSCPSPSGTSCTGSTQWAGLHPSYLPIDFNNSTGTCECSNQTCDRTVVSGSGDWTKFPLLAPPADVENALSSDSSYNCAITYDAGNSQGKAAAHKTPTQGCCSSVYVWTVPSGKATQTTAHLESGGTSEACQEPVY